MQLIDYNFLSKKKQFGGRFRIINHLHTDEEGEGSSKDAKDSSNVYSDEQLEETIDLLLKTMDTNKDGYIEYSEYKNNV